MVGVDPALGLLLSHGEQGHWLLLLYFPVWQWQISPLSSLRLEASN